MSDASSAAPPPAGPRPAAPALVQPAAPVVGAGWPAPGTVVAAPPPAWLVAVAPPRAAAASRQVLLAAVGCGLLCALLLNAGLGANLLIIAVAAAVAAMLGACTAGRRPRLWTLIWAVGALLMPAVPVVSDAGWPTALALIASAGLASLALHGGRTWTGVLFAPFGILWQLIPAVPWAGRTLRALGTDSMPQRQRWLPIVKASLLAVVLLLVFGSLFAAADAAFADLISRLTPTVSVGDSPLRLLLFAGGVLVALGAARTATAPWRWDRYPVRPARPRGRLEWALPLVVLNGLFAMFVSVQLAEWFRDYGALIRDTSGLTYADNARQGFWQLLWVTLLTLVVVTVAQRWAPRDRWLVLLLLGTLCVLTLGVVASALTRMWRYVDAYGLTRLRVWVTGVELWLAVLFLLLMVAGALGRSRWLPRAVLLSGAIAVLAYGFVSPDALVAEQNVQRYERTGRIDLSYVQDLSTDAVPALDRLPADLRACALVSIQANLATSPPPWYATSLSEAKARQLLAARPAVAYRGCQSG